MGQRKTGAKVTALLLSAAMAFNVTPGNVLSLSAATDMSMDEFEESVSTCNIDGSIPGYKEYVRRYEGAARPDRKIVADASCVARYEENDVPAKQNVMRTMRVRRGSASLPGKIPS